VNARERQDRKEKEEEEGDHEEEKGVRTPLFSLPAPDSQLSTPTGLIMDDELRGRLGGIQEALTNLRDSL
jgi:hypothetical protein